MLAIGISIHIIWLPLITMIAFLMGLIFRTYQLQKSKKRILFLENEMLSNHAEILKLQQQLVLLENKLTDNKTPVVPMKESSSEQKPGSSKASKKG